MVEAVSKPEERAKVAVGLGGAEQVGLAGDVASEVFEILTSELPREGFDQGGVGAAGHVFDDLFTQKRGGAVFHFREKR